MQALQSTMGSLKPATWPEASQAFGFWMMAESSPTISTGSPSGPMGGLRTMSLPPGIAQVVLQLDAQGAVVPEAVEPAVDLGGGEDEAAPLAQRGKFVHGYGLLAHRSRILRNPRAPVKRPIAWLVYSAAATEAIPIRTVLASCPTDANGPIRVVEYPVCPLGMIRWKVAPVRVAMPPVGR